MIHTSKFNLYYLAQHQTNKDILVNENFDKIDKLMWAIAQDVNITTPPQNPTTGDIYIVGASPTGTWEKQDNKIALYRDTFGWDFYTPHNGTVIYVAKYNSQYVFNNTWKAINSIPSTLAIPPNTELQNVKMLGINTQANIVDKLCIKSNSINLNNDTDAVITISKGNEQSKSGIVLSNNFSARATLGLMQDDNLKISVSPDGQNFHEGISIQKDSGQLIINNGAYIQGGIQFENNNQKLTSYDHGQWTPILAGENTAGTTQYEYQSGQFTQIG
ncbi:DUF2793 domain-containing protein, partial [Rickettsiales bacterium]|nr:DUF2793 domain-containing protein [Rickettsiales bacterium]